MLLASAFISKIFHSFGDFGAAMSRCLKGGLAFV